MGDDANRLEDNHPVFGPDQIQPRNAAKKPAVFFDRDGTLIKERHFLTAIDHLEILPGVTEAVRRVNQAGLLAIVTTNQSALARGLLTADGLARIHRELSARFLADGAKLNAFYHCPHHPDFPSPGQSGGCSCRKPAPGLLLQAASELNIDLSRSFAVGDRLRDVEAGHRAGCRAILVKTGYGNEEAASLSDDPCASMRRPDLVAEDLPNAVAWILELHGG